MNLAFWLSLVLAASSCFGLILAGRGKWQGWAVGLATQPVWAWFAIVTKSWGLLIVGALYTSVYTKNLIKWRGDQKKLHVMFQASAEYTIRSANEIRRALADKPIILPNAGEERIEWDIDANLPMYTRDYLKWIKERPFEYNVSPTTIGLLGADFKNWQVESSKMVPKEALED